MNEASGVREHGQRFAINARDTTGEVSVPDPAQCAYFGANNRINNWKR